MGVSTRENGILKLVHPGRHVEIHREPVIAAEIMKKYPRHCIARPDVFQFPWIVVRPESVLHPGKVFYLIPCWTLYKLLKNARKRVQTASQENPFSRNGFRRGSSSNSLAVEYTTRSNSRDHAQIKCWGGGITPNPKHRRQRRRLPESMSEARKPSHDQDSEGCESDTSYVDAWTQLTDKLRKLELPSFQETSTDSSFVNSENFHPRRLRNSATNVHIPSTLPIVIPGTMKHTRKPEAQMRLRTCFRKQESRRRLLNLRVTFGPPIVIPFTRSESGSLEQAIRCLQ